MSGRGFKTVLLALVVFSAAYLILRPSESGESAAGGSAAWDGFLPPGFSFKRVASGENINFYTFSGGPVRLDLKEVGGLGPDLAEDMVSDSSAMFESLFEPRRTGYPGQQTKTIECPQDLKPKRSSRKSGGGTFTYYVTYANSNFVSGICSRDLIKYQSVFGYLYCGEKGVLYEVHYYRLINESIDERLFVDSVSCSSMEDLISGSVGGGASGEPGFVEGSVEAVNESINLSCPDCNIVMFNLDLFRADYMGLINSDSNHTRALDEFFRDAIVFEDVTSPAGHTFRSNWATLTGLEGLVFDNTEYHYKDMALFHLEKKWGDYLRKVFTYPTLLEAFHERGYYTVYGKSGDMCGRITGADRGVDDYEFVDGNLISENLEGARELLRGAGEKKPFFLVYRNNDLHNNKYFFFKDDPIVNISGDVELIDKGVYYQLVPKTDNQSINHGIYRARLDMLNEKVGVFLEELERFRNNSIIVLYANHGDGLGDNHMQGHPTPFQSCVHVPLLILHPNVASQIRIKEPVTLIDLAPTLYDMTGVNASFEMQGISLVPAIKGAAYPRKYLFGRNDFDYYVREGELKYIKRQGTEKLLFNLSSDPHETLDLSASNPGKVNELDLVLNERIFESKDFKERQGVVDEETNPLFRVAFAFVPSVRKMLSYLDEKGFFEFPEGLEY